MQNKVIVIIACLFALTSCGNVDDYFGNKSYKDDNPDTMRHSKQKTIDKRFDPCVKSNTPDMNKCLKPHSDQKYVQCLVRAWESLKTQNNDATFSGDVATCKKLYTEVGSGK